MALKDIKNIKFSDKIIQFLEIFTAGAVVLVLVGLIVRAVAYGVSFESEHIFEAETASAIVQDKAFTSEVSPGIALYVKSGTHNFSGINVTKSGDGSDEDFYHYGNNSAVLVTGSGSFIGHSSTIASNGNFAPAISIYNSGSVDLAKQTSVSSVSAPAFYITSDDDASTGSISLTDSSVNASSIFSVASSNATIFVKNTQITSQGGNLLDVSKSNWGVAGRATLTFRDETANGRVIVDNASYAKINLEGKSRLSTSIANAGGTVKIQISKDSTLSIVGDSVAASVKGNGKVLCNGRKLTVGEHDLCSDDPGDIGELEIDRTVPEVTDITKAVATTENKGDNPENPTQENNNSENSGSENFDSPEKTQTENTETDEFGVPLEPTSSEKPATTPVKAASSKADDIPWMTIGIVAAIVIIAIVLIVFVLRKDKKTEEKAKAEQIPTAPTPQDLRDTIEKSKQIDENQIPQDTTIATGIDNGEPTVNITPPVQ